MLIATLRPWFKNFRTKKTNWGILITKASETRLCAREGYFESGTAERFGKTDQKIGFEVGRLVVAFRPLPPRQKRGFLRRRRDTVVGRRSWCGGYAWTYRKMAALFPLRLSF